jgi:hypothetical protein
LLQSVYEWITPDHRDDNDAQREALMQSVSEDLSLPKMLVRVVYEKGYQIEVIVPGYYGMLSRVLGLAPTLGYRLIHLAYEKGQFRD